MYSKETKGLFDLLHKSEIFFKKIASADGGYFKIYPTLNYSAFTGAGFSLPVHTGFPWKYLHKYITPTKMKKNGPRNPNSATNLVP